MKKIAILISALLIAGCGKNDPGVAKKVGISDEQRAKIVERIQPPAIVNLAGEPPEGYTGRYMVAGVVQVTTEEALPGKAKYNGCLACHGANGEGGIGPQLAGQTAEYIVGRLNQYKAGETVGSQSSLMWGQAATLSAQDIADIAEYTASL